MADYIHSGPPTQDEVDLFLADTGFDRLHRHWLWKTSVTETIEIWLGDARAENFKKVQNHIVPIDVRLWFVSENKM